MNTAHAVVSTARPIRTCVGCRSRAHQDDLLRVTAEDGRVVPDPKRRSSGRGAYVHPTRKCVTAANARRAFAKALRIGGPLDPTDLEVAVSALSESKLGASG
jgi:predicted RNA-binding protein YlxR (DUF448 family)